MNTTTKRLARRALVIPMTASLLLAAGCAEEEGAGAGFGEEEFGEFDNRIGDLEEEDQLFDERITRLEEEAGF